MNRAQDEDVRFMILAELRREAIRLRGGIRKHRDAKGNARCWLNDLALYELLPEKNCCSTD